MSSAATSSHERRSLGDRLPAAMLAVVIFASLVILALLAVVLWLAWTSGSPGSQDLVYTSQNFVEVFTDQRTYTVLIDTLGFSLISLAVALGFGIPAAWSLWLGGGLGQASALAIVMLLMMTPLIALYWVIARRQGLVST